MNRLKSDLKYAKKRYKEYKKEKTKDSWTKEQILYWRGRSEGLENFLAYVI